MVLQPIQFGDSLGQFVTFALICLSIERQYFNRLRTTKSNNKAMSYYSTKSDYDLGLRMTVADEQ
jgi:hypothetical protein